MKQYFQCRLSQGNARTVGFIEERGAKIGSSVEIEELGGFWRVDAVGPQMSSDKLFAKQAMDRKSFKSVEARR